MRRIIPLLALLALASPAVRAQSTLVLLGATQHAVTLNWTLAANCTATTPCYQQAYRIDGSCPATLIGSSGWTALPATGSQATTTTDSTVVGGKTYSYVVESQYANGTNSDPSNCVTVTIPNVPGSPTQSAPNVK